MGRKQTGSRTLLVLVFLSLPLCCLPLVALFPSFLFWGQITVINASDETIYITPIGESYGERHIIVKNFSIFPYVPLLKQADIRLKPGQQVQINYEADEDLSLSELAVRNVGGGYRQLEINPTMNFPLLEETYTVEAFDELSIISPEVLAAAEQAGQFNIGVWKMILPGLIPVGLFFGWYRLKRKMNSNSPN